MEYAEGEVRHKSDPELRLGFKELARQLAATGGTITGQSNVDPAGEGNSYAVHIADVEVDPDTGKTEIARFTAVQDVGKAVHPSYVEGQMQGGVVQGIGWALNEEYFFDDNGRMMNPTFLDYRMPTSLDLPMIDTVIVEVANSGHPYGVRGVGEVPIVPPMAAIANGIHEATGAAASQSAHVSWQDSRRTVGTEQELMALTPASISGAGPTPAPTSFSESCTPSAASCMSPCAVFPLARIPLDRDIAPSNTPSQVPLGPVECPRQSRFNDTCLLPSLVTRL